MRPFIQIHPRHLLAVQQYLIVPLFPWINAARGVDHYRMPGMYRTVLAEIEKDFREEARVQVGVGLELHFDKEEWSGGLSVRRLKDSIHAKGGLFELL